MAKCWDGYRRLYRTKKYNIAVNRPQPAPAAQISNASPELRGFGLIFRMLPLSLVEAPAKAVVVPVVKRPTFRPENSRRFRLTCYAP